MMSASSVVTVRWNLAPFQKRLAKFGSRFTTIRTPLIPTSTGAGTASIPAYGLPTAVAVLSSTFGLPARLHRLAFTFPTPRQAGASTNFLANIMCATKSCYTMFPTGKSMRCKGGFALPLEIRDSSDVTFANLHMYRVVSSYQPFQYAVKVSNSKNIRFRNVHCYSDSKVSFDNAVYDQTHEVEIRQREFAWLDISGNAPRPRTLEPSPVLAPGAKIDKVAGGFFNIAGGAIDASGDIYFVDAKWQMIYRWSPQTRQLSIVRNNPIDPVQLAFDKSGNLLVISYQDNGTVYTFKPYTDFDQITLLKPEPSAPRPGMIPVLPVDYWRNENDFTGMVEKKKPYQ